MKIIAFIRPLTGTKNDSSEQLYEVATIQDGIYKGTQRPMNYIDAVSYAATYYETNQSPILVTIETNGPEAKR